MKNISKNLQRLIDSMSPNDILELFIKIEAGDKLGAIKFFSSCTGIPIDLASKTWEYLSNCYTEYWKK